MKQPAVYLVANKRNDTLHIGMASNLVRRIWEHREGMVDGFTKRYGCKNLVWFEAQSTMLEAIAREKQIKGGSRATKIRLIKALNPEWQDLNPAIV